MLRFYYKKGLKEKKNWLMWEGENQRTLKEKLYLLFLQHHLKTIIM